MDRCVTLTLPLGAIPLEYPDKLYLQKLKGLFYQMLKITRLYLHFSGHNTTV